MTSPDAPAPLRRIQVAASELAFDCDGADVLLRAAQRADIGFPYECNVGSCGNCKFELVDGDVETLWEEAPARSDRDRQRGRHLGCQTRPLSDCTIKLRPIDRYRPRHRPQRNRASLVGRRDITHDIAEFRFELEAEQAFEPGQYALASLPGVTGARAYSMSNAADTRHWEFQVRRVPGGSGSAALFALERGQRIGVDGPYGNAWLRRDAPRDIVCLAGGSGLAPMISIARGAMAEPRLAARELHFVYGGRTRADLCGEDMLRALPGWRERGRYHAFVSTASEDGLDVAPAAFVHEAALQLLGERLATMEIYFAGPPAMAQAVQRMLLEAKVPPEQQHFDPFY